MRKILLSLALAAAASCTASRLPAGESIELASARSSAMTVTVDGQPVRLTWYVDNYVTRPNRPEDQLINIYVPETATKASPILFYVNNGGWQSNAYPDGTITDGRAYDGSQDKVGVALKRGYVIVSYGGRSRSNGMTDGKYLGHSPAIMTDTKAAIRYLRYNRKALPAGDTDKIIVTGTSGGGALSTVIAASGNSPDFYPSLYAVGAAGISRRADGTYVSGEGLGDNVLGVIAYCPITDLGHGCAAYEWLFGDTRRALYESGEMNYPAADKETVLAASDALAAMYAAYVDGLGLRDAEGRPVTSADLRERIAALMREEIARSIDEYGIARMQEDLTQEIRMRGPMGGGRGGQQPRAQQGPAQAAQRRVSNGWVTFHADGSFDYDLDKHLLYLARYTTLKVAPAFSNLGLYEGGQNEDSLFGSENEAYCPFNAYSWDHDAKANGVGKDETGLDWDAFMQTPAGQELALQLKMTCAMDYILEGKSDTAPLWYVRHGMDDRDASFAVEATLFHAVMASEKVRDANVGFAWLRPHSGDYDIPEAYAWLEKALQKN